MQLSNRKCITSCVQRPEHATVPKFGDHLNPDLGLFGLSDPKSHKLLLARRVDAQRQVYRLGTIGDCITGFDMDAVQIDDGVQRIQASGMRSVGIIYAGIGHRGN